MLASAALDPPVRGSDRVAVFAATAVVVGTVVVGTVVVGTVGVGGAVVAG
ncbi:MAG: hypothetical protein QOG39_817, partial [Acidimicrobiaceae bacterium]